jgi:hypothetical protein
MQRRDLHRISDTPFFEKLKSLDAGIIKFVVGEYLTDEEIDFSPKRRDLIVAWIDKHIKEKGEERVLYGPHP